jgi:hypothetical protein
MDVIVVFRDWYASVEVDAGDGAIVAAAREELAARHPGARTYEFLPVATVCVDDRAAAEAIGEIPGVEAVVLATSALQFPGAADYYDRMLSALSAIRSQSGHQRFSWGSQASEGGVLPSADWIGGIWPAGPYPSLDLSGRLCRADPSIRRWAAPAQISVLSVSMGPPDVLPTEPNDPLVLALWTMSQTHVVVVAAGNHGPAAATMNPWARGDHVLAVGATDGTGRLWNGSSRGRPDGGQGGPHLVADGTAGDGSIGTSFAAPRVAVLGLFCAALVEQLGAALMQAQGVSRGPSVQALAIIDLSPTTLDIELETTPPFVDLPALPIAA